jgi:hypothetical protein
MSAIGSKQMFLPWSRADKTGQIFAGRV